MLHHSSDPRFSHVFELDASPFSPASPRLAAQVGRSGPARQTSLRLSADGGALCFASRRSLGKLVTVPFASVAKVMTRQVPRPFTHLFDFISHAMDCGNKTLLCFPSN